MIISFFVPGVPVPQGSKSIVRKSGKSWLIDNNVKKLKAWRKTVAEKATEAKQSCKHLYEGTSTANVSLTFSTTRPKGHFTKTGKRSSKYRTFPNVKPDIDKLTRAILDALTGVLFEDDAMVVELYARKVYGQEEGVHIYVSQAKLEEYDDGDSDCDKVQ